MILTRTTRPAVSVGRWSRQVRRWSSNGRLAAAAFRRGLRRLVRRVRPRVPQIPPRPVLRMPVPRPVPLALALLPRPGPVPACPHAP